MYIELYLFRIMFKNIFSIFSANSDSSADNEEVVVRNDRKRPLSVNEISSLYETVAKVNDADLANDTIEKYAMQQRASNQDDSTEIQ